jgi:hypothetical protein
VANRENLKVILGGNSKNGSANSQKTELMHAEIGELRKELRLIDQTIEVLIKLSKFRQKNRPAKSLG